MSHAATTSTSSRPGIKTDPALLRLLDEPDNADGLVSAVFRLRTGRAARAALSPGETEEWASELVERVSHQVGEAAERVNVFRNLGAFLVRARPRFLRELLCQPEIDSALANRADEEVAIRPVPSRAAPRSQRAARRRR